MLCLSLSAGKLDGPPVQAQTPQFVLYRSTYIETDRWSKLLKWREDCTGCTEVSGLTVRQWQMVYMAHGSGRWGGGSTQAGKQEREQSDLLGK